MSRITHKLKYLKYKILIILSIIFALFFALSIDTQAKSYEIRNAKFDINIEEDGSAIVTETYTVDFNGEYSRFYKEFNTKKIKNVEKVAYFKLLDVKINGKECEEASNSINRTDYTYYKGMTDLGYQVNMYYHASNETVKYEVTYKLAYAVKEITDGDPNTAIFCYRLVGANFETTIEKIEINISGAGLNLDNKDSLDIRYLTNLKQYDIEKTSTGYKLINNKGHKAKSVLKLNIALNSKEFKSLYYEMTVKESNKNTYKNEIIEILEITTPGIIILLVVMLIINRSIFIVIKHTKLNKKNPKYMDIQYNKLTTLNFNILSVYYKNKKLKPNKLIKIYLLGLRLQEVIKVKGDRIEINTKAADTLIQIERDTLYSILNIIGENKYNYKGNIDLNINEFSNIIRGKRRVKTEEIRAKLHQLINYYNEYFRTNSSYEYEKAIKMVYEYIVIVMRLTNTTSTNSVLKHSLTKEEALIWMYSDQTKVIRDRKSYTKKLEKIKNQEAGMEDIFDYYLDSIRFYNTETSSSSSGCSSCSSCSSCGGCGGGGAD